MTQPQQAQQTKKINLISVVNSEVEYFRVCGDYYTLQNLYYTADTGAEVQVNGGTIITDPSKLYYRHAATKKVVGWRNKETQEFVTPAERMDASEKWDDLKDSGLSFEQEVEYLRFLHKWEPVVTEQPASQEPVETKIFQVQFVSEIPEIQSECLHDVSFFRQNLTEVPYIFNATVYSMRVLKEFVEKQYQGSTFKVELKDYQFAKINNDYVTYDAYKASPSLFVGEKRGSLDFCKRMAEEIKTKTEQAVLKLYSKQNPSVITDELRANLIKLVDELAKELYSIESMRKTVGHLNRARTQVDNLMEVLVESARK